MAPNVVSKSGHLHDSYNSGNATASRPISLRTKSQVRTEFLVSSIFYHFLESYGYQERQEDVSTPNRSEVEVLETFKKVVSDFKTSYSDKIVELCSQLEVTTENVHGVFLGVINELFSEGITWARISALFVFSSELAAQCLQKELPETIVEMILECCLEFVHDNLENWVTDHGGWEGIITFAKGHKNTSSQPQPNKAESPGWAKSVLHGTLRMFGTLAHIANSTGQIMDVPMRNVKI